MKVKPLPLPEAALLNEYLNYDPLTGDVTYKKKTSRNVNVGDSVGRKNPVLYRDVSLFKSRYLLHRIIWRMVTGEDPGEIEVDHIDTDKLNNRWINLRLAHGNGNYHNDSLRKNNTSGIKGVSWDNRYQKWVAQLMINRKVIWLGFFNNKEDAGEVVRVAREKYHGKFTNHG